MNRSNEATLSVTRYPTNKLFKEPVLDLDSKRKEALSKPFNSITNENKILKSAYSITYRLMWNNLTEYYTTVH